MFTNVPLSEIQRLSEDGLFGNQRYVILNVRPAKQSFRGGLNLCAEDHVFNFDGKVHVHRNSAATCSLPSPVST